MAGGKLYTRDFAVECSSDPLVDENEALVKREEDLDAASRIALTLPAFVPGPPSLYMVEEPENGVHPHALEIIVKALAAIPGAQVFVATHSPLVVQQVGPKPLLCFTRGEKTGVQIIHGENHPALKDWQGSPDLASIFASRVFG
jgi:predicted ATPase